MKIEGVLQWLLLVALTHSEENCTQDSERKYYYIYNTTVEMDAYYCSDSKDWDDLVVCRNMFCVYYNIFAPWTNKNGQMFIRDANISLSLTEKIEFCRYSDVWKTNYDEIIVSSKKFNYLNTTQLTKLQSNFTEFCKKKNNNHKSTINTIKTWYIYKYPTSVITYTCHKNIQESCEDLKRGETVPINNKQNLVNKCKKNFCDVPACSTRKSIFTICRRTLEVDLEKNSVGQLPSECKYSGGICKSPSTFWEYTNLCHAIERVCEAHESTYFFKKCLTVNVNCTINRKLKLFRKGKLCGKTVWFTNKTGLIASEERLDFFPSKTSGPLDQDKKHENQISVHSNQVDNHDETPSEEIDDLENSLHYLLYILVICALWYVFNVVVNLSSLRKLNKLRPSREKVNLVNCLSDGLTVYHLSFNQREKKPKKVVSNVQTPQLYESVENELYR